MEYVLVGLLLGVAGYFIYKKVTAKKDADTTTGTGGGGSGSNAKQK